MFQRVLIANRGEIALRVIRACRELDVESVVVYSQADAGAPYLELADEAICIGPGPSAKSYLSIPNIISAAEIADVDAVHPGYGFLSENSHFAEICRANNIEFIGPDVATIRRVGDKAEAKAAAVAAGIPVVEGSDGPVNNDEEALEVARKVGYPVLIKAVSGGGGRGMRVAHNDMSLVTNLQTARTEAQAAFGDANVYIEKYIEDPRHVEIQILGDKKGDVIHLGERDCSVQRRHQKVIEESPSPALGNDLRTKMGRAAVKLAKSVGYHGAGTVEFLVSGKSFYFIEVNARIQVEHPVTELVTGIDLIREQIRIASGETLGRKQQHVNFRGHAIEVRINAEDPDRNFAPSPGLVTSYRPAGGPGVRIDSHVVSGYRIPPYYDSMIAKVLVHADTRDEAILRMRRAMDEYKVDGVKTNLGLHRRILRNAYFQRGEYSTRFLDELLSA
ncbi:MAG: acetyl-CoA carboxylase biotin carboxylase subunit [Planctomycetota bacterium]|nr:acetyl-CoA carboxylase biotin carboxylase subunit [Planctomycetota bacterium]MCB9825506.1 acetyl-CoA carboxylase biotin carboxylase subunit [Planctomycetota bacterium]MCB9900600.1 acetyl-CoA carboxylase biotin carboxylase subunit [Planctomycetota bacterium]